MKKGVGLTGHCYMGNWKHRARLLLGVDAWNKWRKKHPETMPDLSQANFRNANLSYANLSNADLSSTNLIEANLNYANLRGANLSKAYLLGAKLNCVNLIDANLNEANFSCAKLSNANLLGADLSDTDFLLADLGRANFFGANLSKIKLDFRGFQYLQNLNNLKKAKLSGANLSGIDLSETDFSGVDLSGINLSNANLCGANLSHTDLRWAVLNRVQALAANFQDAILTGACIEDWNINSTTQLDGVICEYVYLRYPHNERRPSSGSFAPGEFTRIFQKVLETVDLIFLKGIEWQAFEASFKKLQIQAVTAQLSIQSIEKKPDGAFVIRVQVPPDANKEEIEKYLKREYEFHLKAIDEKYQHQLKAKDEQIAIYRQQSANMMEIVKLMASRPIDVKAIAISESESMSEASKYNMSNAKNVNFIDTNNQGTQNVTYNTYEAAEKQNLAEALQEIQQLIQQLEQTYPTNTLIEQATIAEKAIEHIENNPTLKQRILAALKTFTIEAFKEAIDNPVVNIMLPTLESWQKGE